MPLPLPSPQSIALVTGASSGIGEQFARQLSALGHRVALVARREDRLHSLAAELGGAERAVVIAADLADPASRDAIGARLSELGAEVEILVNNAGFGVYTSFLEAGRERELAQLRVDVEAVVDLTARYLPGMVARSRGAIINLASTAGFQPLPYNAGYAAAKGYVLLLSEALSVEVKEHNVSVTAVCPGPVATEFIAVNNATFASRLPKLTHVSAERVAADSLAAADRGKRMVVPGNTFVKAFFAPNRRTPAAIGLPIAKLLMKP